LRSFRIYSHSSRLLSSPLLTDFDGELAGEEEEGEGEGLRVRCLLGESSILVRDSETRMFAFESAGLSNLCLAATAYDYGRGYAMGSVAMAAICSLRVLMPRGLSMHSPATTSSCS
jgi:hypothetical protein